MRLKVISTVLAVTTMGGLALVTAPVASAQTNSELGRVNLAAASSTSTSLVCNYQDDASTDYAYGCLENEGVGAAAELVSPSSVDSHWSPFASDGNVSNYGDCLEADVPNAGEVSTYSPCENNKYLDWQEVNPMNTFTSGGITYNFGEIQNQQTGLCLEGDEDGAAVKLTTINCDTEYNGEFWSWYSFTPK